MSSGSLALILRSLDICSLQKRSASSGRQDVSTNVLRIFSDLPSSVSQSRCSTSQIASEQAVVKGSIGTISISPVIGSTISRLAMTM